MASRHRSDDTSASDDACLDDNTKSASDNEPEDVKYYDDSQNHVLRKGRLEAMKRGDDDTGERPQAWAGDWVQVPGRRRAKQKEWPKREKRDGPSSKSFTAHQWLYEDDKTQDDMVVAQRTLNDVCNCVADHVTPRL